MYRSILYDSVVAASAAAAVVGLVAASTLAYSVCVV